LTEVFIEAFQRVVAPVDDVFKCQLSIPMLAVQVIDVPVFDVVQFQPSFYKVRPKFGVLCCMSRGRMGINQSDFCLAVGDALLLNVTWRDDGKYLQNTTRSNKRSN
jgi:hypothetical protein